MLLLVLLLGISLLKKNLTPVDLLLQPLLCLDRQLSPIYIARIVDITPNASPTVPARSENGLLTL